MEQWSTQMGAGWLGTKKPGEPGGRPTLATLSAGCPYTVPSSGGQWNCKSQAGCTAAAFVSARQNCSIDEPPPASSPPSLAAAFQRHSIAAARKLLQLLQAPQGHPKLIFYSRGVRQGLWAGVRGETGGQGGAGVPETGRHAVLTIRQHTL